MAVSTRVNGLPFTVEQLNQVALMGPIYLPEHSLSYRLDGWENGQMRDGEREDTVWLKNRCGLQRAIEESASLTRIFHLRSFNKGFLFQSTTGRWTSRLLSSLLETFIHSSDLEICVYFQYFDSILDIKQPLHTVKHTVEGELWQVQCVWRLNHNYTTWIQYKFLIWLK